MRRVYLAHPLGSGIDRALNRERAAEWATWLSQAFQVAISADWIWLSGELEESPENRSHGLACDLVHVERCDELWAVGHKFSGGMTIEAEHARSHGVSVYDLTGIGKDFDTVVNALRDQGWK